MTQDDLKQIGKVIQSHLKPFSKHIDTLDKGLNKRIETLEIKMERRFEGMERRFEAQDTKLDQLRSDVTATVERVLDTINELHVEDDQRLRRIEEHLHLKRPA
ncbi:MAG: hypothetical protein HYV40_00680 [Candidatus Levybacteria bacterium]|nr:hypothetical protein [Candidatus Levybacteria bacterium]